VEDPVEDPDVYKGSPPGPRDTYTHSAAGGGGDAYSAKNSENNPNKYRWVRETQPAKGQNFAATDWDVLDYHYYDILEQAFARQSPGIIEMGDVSFDLSDRENMTMTYKTQKLTRKIKRQPQN
jgi:hypothetical protein